MGMANSPLGFYYGFITTAMPFLLAGRGVSTVRIAAVSSIAFSPTFWAFLLSPVLDVRFSKRQYCLGLFSFAALCLGSAVLVMGSLGWFTALLTLGCTAAALGGNALGALLNEIVEADRLGRLGAWFNVANLGAAGVFGSVAIMLVRHALLPIAALGMVAILLAPMLLFLFFPAMPRPTRSVGETFRTLFRDLFLVLKRRECLLGLAAFLAPGSAFALTNLFAGLGNAYHAPETWVAWISGVGVALACSAGCLLGGPVADRFPRGQVYVITGIVGATVSFTMIFAPRTTLVFVVGVLAYNLAQGLNYTAFSALTFELTGKNNPLAGTQIALLTASGNLPISYMTALDGLGSAHFGLNGMYAVDSGLSIVACAGLLLLFRWAARKRIEEVALIVTS
jgi:PAT family beta-lactamase induction signal transducer AmpG